VTHTLGPGDGTLSVRTTRTGAAAKAGHDLLIEVTGWKATLEVGETTRIAFEADPTSLRVREGTGGMQALGDDDRASIAQTIDDEILRREAIEFRSTAVRAGEDGRLDVEGDLTLAGRTAAIAFEASLADDGSVTANAIVRQTDWGIKPYSALFGALKVADEVAVELVATLPGQSR
jgi:YceI-like domain